MRNCMDFTTHCIRPDHAFASDLTSTLRVLYRQKSPEAVGRLDKILRESVVHIARPSYKCKIPAHQSGIEALSPPLYLSLKSGNETIGTLRVTKGDAPSGPNIYDEVMQNPLMSTSRLTLSELKLISQAQF
jgi:hypothetical protein